MNNKSKITDVKYQDWLNHLCDDLGVVLYLRKKEDVKPKLLVKKSLDEKMEWLAYNLFCGVFANDIGGVQEFLEMREKVCHSSDVNNAKP